MANLESRVEKLEQVLGQMVKTRKIVCAFVRPEDGFPCGYLRIKTGEEVTQGDTETDADFVMRANAAGFERAGHAKP